MYRANWHSISHRLYNKLIHKSVCNPKIIPRYLVLSTLHVAGFRSNSPRYLSKNYRDRLAHPFEITLRSKCPGEKRSSLKTFVQVPRSVHHLAVLRTGFFPRGFRLGQKRPETSRQHFAYHPGGSPFHIPRNFQAHLSTRCRQRRRG